MWLAQLQLGELPPQTQHILRAELGHQLAPALQRLRIEDDKMLQHYPPERIAAQITAKAAKKGREPLKTWRRITAVPTLALSALALGLLVLPLSPTNSIGSLSLKNAPDPAILSSPSTESTRSKGLSPHLVIQRLRLDGSIDRLNANSDAKEGDVLQLSYVAAGHRHGVVLSIDGRGVVTLHHPQQLRSSTRLAERGETALAHAYELDDAPDFERFIFVASNSEIDVTRVMAAAQTLVHDADAASRSLALPTPWHQSSFRLPKVPGPSIATSKRR